MRTHATLELVAQAIHQHSPRKGKPYVIVDCGAVTGSLLESQLFGHARGSFTGAVQQQEGAFEAANGGTLFLDEIGELPLELQPKLLRALEARAVRRIGENEYKPVDVRVVSASHRDLREMVNQRAFREDLYFRLAVVPVRIPPLRERFEDLPMLIEHFFEKLPNAPRPTALELEKLMQRPWSGNVRDLRNVVDRAAIYGWEHELLGDVDAARVRPDVPASTMPAESGVSVDPNSLPTLGGPFYEARERWLEYFERVYVKALLEKYRYDIMEAAIMAGLHNSYLRKIIKKRGL